jgi:WD40 repeat protein
MVTLLASQQQEGILQYVPSGQGSFGGIVQGMAFSPDGKFLATTAPDDAAPRLWNLATGQAVGIPLPTASVQDVAFSPDGKFLATADADGTARLWNPATGRPLGRPLPAGAGRNRSVNAVAFSPDGKLLATAESDVRGGGTVRLWNLVTGRPVGSALPADWMAFSPDGKFLVTAVAGGSTVRLWDLATGRPVGNPLPADTSSVHDLEFNAISVNVAEFSPDGKLLATFGGGTVRLWNLATGQAVGSPLPAGAGHDRSVDAVPCLRAPGSTAELTPWRSVRTASSWPSSNATYQAMPVRCGCGIWPPAGPWAGPCPLTPRPAAGTGLLSVRTASS